MADDPQPPPPPPTPPVAPPPPPAGQPVVASQVPRWRSSRGLTAVLPLLFAADAVAALIAVFALVKRLGVLNDIENNGLSVDVINRDSDAVDLANGATLTLFILSLVTAIFFITCMWRVAKNNEALGRQQPRLGPGWAIGGWFIPIANLVIPVLVMQDLWRGSDPSVPRGDMRWKIGPRSALVGWWWGLLLLSFVRVTFGGQDRERSRTVSDVRTNTTFVLIGMAFTVAAAVLAILIVRRITARQEECLRAQQQAWTGEHGGTPQPQS